MDINSKEFDLGQEAEEASPELGELLQIDELRHRSEVELFEQAETQNVDHVSPASCDNELAEGIEAFQEVESLLRDILEGKGGRKAVLRLLTAAYIIHVWSIEHADDFTATLDRHKVKVRKDANPAVVVFKLLSKLAGTTYVRSYASKWAAVVDLGIRESLSTDDFPMYIEEIGGWTIAYDFYQKKYAKPEGSERRRVKKLKQAKAVAHLEAHAPTISTLPPASNDNHAPCTGTGGLGLLVYREGVDGEDGIIGRVRLSVEDAQNIITKYGLAMGDEQIDAIVNAVAAEQDKKENEDEAA